MREEDAGAVARFDEVDEIHVAAGRIVSDARCGPSTAAPSRITRIDFRRSIPRRAPISRALQRQDDTAVFTSRPPAAEKLAGVARGPYGQQAGMGRARN